MFITKYSNYDLLVVVWICLGARGYPIKPILKAMIASADNIVGSEYTLDIGD